MGNELYSQLKLPLAKLYSSLLRKMLPTLIKLENRKLFDSKPPSTNNSRVTSPTAVEKQFFYSPPGSASSSGKQMKISWPTTANASLAAISKEGEIGESPSTDCF